MNIGRVSDEVDEEMTKKKVKLNQNVGASSFAVRPSALFSKEPSKLTRTAAGFRQQKPEKHTLIPQLSNSQSKDDICVKNQLGRQSVSDESSLKRQYDKALTFLHGQNSVDISASDGAKKPRSFVIMRVSFKRKVFGVSWLLGQLVDIHTDIHGEINQAQKLRKIKPRMRVMKPCAPASQEQASNRSSDASTRSMQSDLNSFIPYADGTLVVIENPVFTDQIFSKSNRSGDEVDLAQLLVANEEQGGYLTVLSPGIAALSDTQMSDYQLQINKDSPMKVDEENEDGKMDID